MTELSNIMLHPLVLNETACHYSQTLVQFWTLGHFDQDVEQRLIPVSLNSSI